MKLQTLWSVSLFGWLVLCSPVPIAVLQAGQTVTVPAGTTIAIRTIDRISSVGTASNLEYRATVDDSVTVGAGTVIPVGAAAYLRVVEVQQAGAVRGRASLSLRLVGLDIDGRRLQFNTGDAQIKSGSQAARSAKAGATGAVIGGVLGGLLGGKSGAVQGASIGAAAGVSAAVVVGQRVVVPSETRLSFTLTGNSSPADLTINANDSSLLEQLTAVESKAAELTKAGDRQAVDSLLDPSFTMNFDGRTISRSQYLSQVKPQPAIISASIESPQARFENNQGVITGYYALEVRQKSQSKTIRQKFRDVFVQRDGHWLLLESEVVTQ